MKRGGGLRGDLRREGKFYAVSCAGGPAAAAPALHTRHGAFPDGPRRQPGRATSSLRAQRNSPPPPQATAVKGLTKGIEGLLKKNKVTYVKGWGRLLSGNEVEVDGLDGEKTTVKAKNILIATGSEVSPLPGVNIDEETCVARGRGAGLPSRLCAGSAATLDAPSPRVASGQHAFPLFRAPAGSCPPPAS